MYDAWSVLAARLSLSIFPRFLSSVAQQDEEEDDDEEEDGGSDFEPTKSEGSARDAWIATSKSINRDGKRAARSAGAKIPSTYPGKTTANNRPDDKGGRWGGGKTGLDPSALLADPNANCKSQGTLEEGGGGEEDVEVVLGDTTGRASVRRGGAGRGPMQGGTLVVCPLSLIGQWREEVESKTRKGALSVSFYYGTTRSRCDDVRMSSRAVLSSFELLIIV